MNISTTSSVSIFGRLKNAIVAVFIGILMIPFSIGLTGWNEYRSVQRIRTLNEGLGAVVPNVDVSTKDNSLEGKLIHFTAKAETASELKDPLFGIGANAIKLQRDVEMYQWVEKKETKSRKRVGGGRTSTTTYSYSKKWQSGYEDSSRFHEPAGHENPRPEYSHFDATAEMVSVGAYKLSKSILGSITSYEPINLTNENLDSLPDQIKSKAKLEQGVFYIRKGEFDLGEPIVGDLRVRFRVIRTQEVSIVSQVAGDSFQKYHAKAGDLELVDMGRVSAEDMFDEAKSENATFTWILRAVGFAMCGIGFSMILGPIGVVMDVIPFFGTLARGGILIISFLFSVVIISVTVAISWIAVRPLVGIPMLLLAVGGVVGIFMLRNKFSKSPPPKPPYSADDDQVEVVS